MRLLLDTNVVVDYAARRGGFYPLARLLLELAAVGEFELWISAAQATDVFYLLSNGGRSSDASGARAALKSLRRYVRVASITESDVDKALDAGWDDFEDACVYFAALRVKADAIVTRNQKDFERSSIKVFDCEGLFGYLEREKGIVYGEARL